MHKLSTPTLLAVLVIASGAAIYFLVMPPRGANAPLLADNTGAVRQPNGAAAPSALPEKSPAADAASSSSLGTQKPAFPASLSVFALIGTARKSDGMAYAVIRNRVSGIQRLYMKGDRLATAEITEIEPDRVAVRIGRNRFVIRRSGRDIDGGSGEPLRPPRDLPPRDFSRPDPERMQRGWEAVRELMVQIELNAHTSNGESDGVRVGDVRPDSVFDRAGLQPGDIIHAVNGRRIVIEDDAMEIYEVFRTPEPIRLEIERDGAPQVLEYLP